MKRKALVLHIISLIAVLILSAPALGASRLQIDLKWAPCTDSDLAGYRVYYSFQSGHYKFIGKTTSFDPRNYPNYLLSIPGSRSAASFIITVPSAPKIFFVITAVDRSGNESRPSNELYFEAPAESSPDSDKSLGVFLGGLAGISFGVILAWVILSGIYRAKTWATDLISSLRENKKSRAARREEDEIARKFRELSNNLPNINPKSKI
jgi:hypothetical protein